MSLNASNDGYLLQYFNEKYRLAIEPTQYAAGSRNKVQTRTEFFTEDYAKTIRRI